MSVIPTKAATSTQFAEFDSEDQLMASSPGFLVGGPAAFLETLTDLNLSIDEALEQWRSPDAMLWARTEEAQNILLTSHPTAAGGYCLVATVTGASFAEKLIDRHPLPIWANDIESGEILFHNTKAERLFGVTGQDKAPKVVDFITDLEENSRILDEMRLNGEVEGYLLRARSLEGREFWVSGAGTLIEHEGRKIVFSAIQDVTTLKQHELEIARSRQLLGDALRTLKEAFALFDEDGCLIMWNDQYRAIHSGISEFISQGIHWETLLRETARRRIARHALGRESAWVADTLERGENYESFEVARTDGSTILVTVHPTTLGGFIVSEVDITRERQAEISAQESEQMLSKVLEASPANLCMSRITDGEIIYRSPASTALFGREASARDQFQDPMEWADFLTDLLPSGRIDDFPATAQNADGDQFPALFSARIVDYKGEDVVVSSVTDLTDQYRARQQLAEANRRLSDAIESLDEGFALYDRDERLVLWNERYADLNAHVATQIREGISYSELLDAAIASGRLGPADIERTIESGRPDQDGTPRRFEFEHRDGKWFSVSRNPTSEGGFVITRLDITERKKAEAAQREADELVRRVLDACPVNLLMCRSSDGEVIYHSKNTVERFGRRKWVSQYWTDVEAGAAMAADIVKQNGYDLRLFDIKGVDEEAVTVELSSRQIDFGGEPMIVSHAYDMTDRFTMEAELSRQRDMLHQTEKLSALGELLAGVAHELNNPLSVVVGHALMLEEEIEDQSLRARTAKISSAAERCSRIVKTFLAMARQRPARLELTSLNSVIETALDVAGYGLRKNGAKISLDLAPDLPHVMADADQLAQVFANLIVNAEHVLASQGMEGAFDMRSRISRSGREVVVEVNDNGPGIPEPILARIFEPFFTTKAIGEGTGIGLAFCHRIIATHDGQIAVKNRQEGGACFTIRLKVAEAAVVIQDGDGSGAPSQRSNGRALVIDDEADIAELIAQVLSSDGFDVVIAHSAEEALALLPGSFDVILSDLNMPEMNGQALMSEIKERWPHLLPRLGFVTGDTVSEGIEEFLAASTRPHLEKPVSPADLRGLAAGLMKSA